MQSEEGDGKTAVPRGEPGELRKIPPPVVAVQGVHWVRDGVPILRGIDWQVLPGEHWAVLGRNGCGKTTLMRIVSGRLHPTRGRVTVLGRQFGKCRMAEVQRRVGWVSSALQGMLRPRLRAVGVVLAGRTAGLGVFEDPSIEEVDAAMAHLEQAGCAAVAQRPFARLSQGEQMRVMIARALFNKPEILVLDEPCVGLDPPAREGLLALLERLAAEPDAPALVYVTHHIEEIIPAISHVLLMRAGRPVAAGPKAAMLTPEKLARTFECPFHIERIGARYFARIPAAALRSGLGSAPHPEAGATQPGRRDFSPG